MRARLDYTAVPTRPGLAYGIFIPTDDGNRRAAAIEYERRLWVVVSWAPSREANSFVPSRIVPATSLGPVEAEVPESREVGDVTFFVLDVVPSAVFEPALPPESRTELGVLDDPPSVFRYRLPRGELVGTPTR